MNLAGFLHSLKEFKDSTLSLPLAPVFSLPAQKWYFSSPALVPLRKRKENTSFFKYLEEFDLMNEKKQVQDRVSGNKKLLCLYENKDYVDEKIHHIFNQIYMECRSEVKNRQRIKCECVGEVDEKKSITFGLSVDTINTTLQASKKHFKSQTPLNKEQAINWCEFAKIITKQHTSKILRHEDQLHIYKLPDSLAQETVFSLLWNDNFIVFSNNQLQVNQHMKAKAVELSDLLHKKLEEFIWKKFQMILEKAEDINDYDMFIQKAKNIIKIHTFRIWFYKKEENNEIYILGLSDLSFKGVECVMFKDVGFKCQQSDHLEAKMKDFELDQKQNSFSKKKFLENGREKLKSLREVNKLHDIQTLLDWKSKPKPQKIDSQKPEITQIQCSCCKNLLLSNQIVNQITANKIQQVRYLRQIKIGKIQFDPYDFVKVCTLCYSVYLKHYKQSFSKSKSQKCQKTQKAYSYYEKSQKENCNNKTDKEASFYLQRKIDETNFKTAAPSLRGLIRDRSLNIRAKSELNNSKQSQNITVQQIQKKSYFNRKRQPSKSLMNQNQKKYKTTKTNNTQAVDSEGVNNKLTIKDQITLQRTLTNNDKPSNLALQKDFLPKSRSFKLKGGGIPKHVNIINKIIMNTTNPTEKTENICSNIPKLKENQSNKWQQQLKIAINSDFSQIGDQRTQQTKMERNTVITSAIDEYENLSRPSFKKLIYKGHKNIIKRQMNLGYENGWQEDKFQNRKKKSIFSYCQQ